MNKVLIGLSILNAAFSTSVVFADDMTGPSTTNSNVTTQSTTQDAMGNQKTTTDSTTVVGPNSGPSEMDLNAPSTDDKGMPSTTTTTKSTTTTN